MGEFQRRGDRTLRWIGRVLIKFELFDRDSEWRRLHFVNEPLHQHMIREKFLVEDDTEFQVGRPIFGRLENKDVGLEPAPGTVEFRLKVHALDRRPF